MREGRLWAAWAPVRKNVGTAFDFGRARSTATACEDKRQCDRVVVLGLLGCEVPRWNLASKVHTVSSYFGRFAPAGAGEQEERHDGSGSVRALWSPSAARRWLSMCHTSPTFSCGTRPLRGLLAFHMPLSTDTGLAGRVGFVVRAQSRD